MNGNELSKMREFSLRAEEEFCAEKTDKFYGSNAYTDVQWTKTED